MIDLSAVLRPMKSRLPALLLLAPIFSIEAITLEPYPVPAVPTLFDETSTAENIGNRKPVDVAEILSRGMGNVSYIRKGPVAGDFLLRGLGRDNVLVTLDGGRTCGACPNRMDPPAFHVGTSRIEAISVRPGPFDVEEGGVVGGIVRVETSTAPTYDFLDASVFAGSFATLAANASAGTVLEKGDLSGGLDFRQGDPYKDGDGHLVTEAPKGPAAYRPSDLDRTAYSILGGDARAALRTGDSEWVASGGFNLADEVLYPGLRMDAVYDRSLRGGLTYRYAKAVPIADEWAAQITGSAVDHRMDDGFRLSSFSQPVWRERGYMMRTQARTSFWSARLRARKDTGTILWHYGLGYEERSWDADNVIMTTRNNMIPDVLTRSANLWSKAVRETDKWDFEVGLRLEAARSRARDDISFLQSSRNTDANEEDDLLPSGYILARRALSDSLWVQGGIGHGERLPDPQERYINLRHPNPAMPDWIGNPGLDPVSNSEIQARVGGTVGTFDFTFGGFYAYLSDYIYLASLRSEEGPARTYENIDAELYGLDASVGWEILEQLRLEAGVGWQGGRKLTLATGNDDRDLGEIPPLSGHLAALWTPVTDLSITAEGLIADAQEDLDTDLGEQRIAGYAVFNVRADWRINETLGLGVGIDNVFDRSYAVHNAYLRDPFSAGVVVNEPGRFLYLRLAAHF